jgi:hypothetical protein
MGKAIALAASVMKAGRKTLISYSSSLEEIIQTIKEK